LINSNVTGLIFAGLLMLAVIQLLHWRDGIDIAGNVPDPYSL
jgi:hypothetical protein